jgi:hypothetical protein
MKRPVNLHETRHIRASRREKLARPDAGKKCQFEEGFPLTAGKSRY